MPYAKKISGIYLLTNRITGKSYIGQSINIMSRWSQIKSMSAIGMQLINRNVAEYGWDAFDRKILIMVSNKADLDRYEADCIRIYNTISPNGLNDRGGGIGGFVVEERTKAIISEKSKGKDRNWTPQGRKNVERTQFKKGDKGKNIFAGKTPEECERIRKKISESLRKTQAEHPHLRENYKKTAAWKAREILLATCHTIKCKHCGTHRVSTDFYEHLNGNLFKNCKICTDGQRSRMKSKE